MNIIYEPEVVIEESVEEFIIYNNSDKCVYAGQYKNVNKLTGYPIMSGGKLRIDKVKSDFDILYINR